MAPFSKEENFDQTCAWM